MTKPLVFVIMSFVGLLIFLVTGLMSGHSADAVWARDGVVGVILWAYRRASLSTDLVLFGVALGCGWYLGSWSSWCAVSLASFYPTFALIRLLLGLHDDAVAPLQIVSFVFFLIICLAGFWVGKFARARLERR